VVVERTGAPPSRDLISMMIHSDAMKHMSPQEFMGNLVLLIVGGCMMVALGIIGLYIGYIFQEVKGRPVFLVRKHQLAAKYRDTTGKTPA